MSYNQNINKKLQSQLNKLCKDCELKNRAGKCPHSNKSDTISKFGPYENSSKCLC